MGKEKPIDPKSKFIIAGLVALAAAVRIYVIRFTTLDLQLYNLPWYEITRENGLRSLKYAFTDYPPLYDHILLITHYLFGAAPPVIALKIIPICVDFAAAWGVYRLVRLEKSLEESWAAFIATLMLPTLILNSACWGQTDVFYGAASVFCVLFVIQRRPVAAMTVFSIGCAFKLQCLFLIPFLLVATHRGHVRIRDWFLIPLIFVLSGVPSVLMGRSWQSVLMVYPEQFMWGQALSNFTPNFYAFISDENYWPMLWLGLAIGGIACLLPLYLATRTIKNLTTAEWLKTAVLASALMPFFLPKMRGRYFFVAELLSVALVFFDRRLWPLPVILQVTSLSGYARYLIEIDPVAPPWIVALLNGVALWVLLRDYAEQMNSSRQKKSIFKPSRFFR